MLSTEEAVSTSLAVRVMEVVHLGLRRWHMSPTRVGVILGPCGRRTSVVQTLAQLLDRAQVGEVNWTGPRVCGCPGR
jgi:hypothetical protein